MKVYSIPNYNYNHNYNVQNRNLQKKDCPEPCFGNGQQTRFLQRKAPWLLGLTMVLGGLISSCTQNNFYFEGQSAKAFAGVFINGFNPGNVQPSDTIPSDTTHTTTPQKPKDMFDLEISNLNIHSGDTSGFTKTFYEMFGMYGHEYLTSYNEALSKGDTTAYDVYIRHNHDAMDTIGHYIAKRHGARYNNQDIVVENREYLSGMDNNTFSKPDKVYISKTPEGVTYIGYDNAGQLMDKRVRYIKNGQYLEDFGPDLNSNQDIELDFTAVPWSQVAPLNGGKGKN